MRVALLFLLGMAATDGVAVENLALEPLWTADTGG
jgi:hypothetical protein